MVQRRRLVTMHDVAKHAYVSLGTVSRVFNQHANVDADLRERVLMTARTLGYVHHPPHLQPTSSTLSPAVFTTTHRLACICYRSDHPMPDHLAPLSLSLLLQGAEEEARQQGWSLLTSFFADAPDERAQLLSFLADTHAEALLLVAFPPDLLHALLQDITIPIVLVGCDEHLPLLDTIAEDHHHGMFNLTNHLLEQGHRQIMYAGPTTLQPWQSRYEGYQLALRSHLLHCQETHLLPCSPSVEGGHAAGMLLLQQQPPCTAVVCSNDLVAIGLMQALVEQGKVIPRDLSIVGYDDSEAARLVIPRLTTVRSHTEQVGHMAVLKALQRVNYPLFPFTRTIIQTQLIIRDSVLPLS